MWICCGLQVSDVREARLGHKSWGCRHWPSHRPDSLRLLVLCVVCFVHSRDSGCDVEHDDGTLALNVVPTINRWIVKRMSQMSSLSLCLSFGIAIYIFFFFLYCCSSVFSVLCSMFFCFCYL